MNKKNLILLFLISLILIFISTTMGITNIPFEIASNVLLHKLFFIPLDKTINSGQIAIIFNIRFPRVILAFLTGGALAVCGGAYQGIFKNPMADPFILGVSSGAAFGAAVGIVLNLSQTILTLNLTTILAFLGAFCTIFLVYSIAKMGNKVPVDSLLLSGIAFSQILTALMSLIMIFNIDSMQQIVFWTMGSFNGKGWNQILIILPYLLIGYIVLFTTLKELDIMLLGEETANNLGVEVESLKRKVLFASSLIIASVVSVTGVIGFVGLIIPHICRLIFGPRNINIIPISIFLGGMLLIICDTASRSLFSQEVPVGIITALLGGPFFIYLLKRKQRS